MISTLDLLKPYKLIASVAITAILFALAAYFSRAGRLRIIGVLIASLPIIPMVMFYDRIAAQLARLPEHQKRRLKGKSVTNATR